MEQFYIYGIFFLVFIIVFATSYYFLVIKRSKKRYKKHSQAYLAEISEVQHKLSILRKQSQTFKNHNNHYSGETKKRLGTIIQDISNIENQNAHILKLSQNVEDTLQSGQKLAVIEQDMRQIVDLLEKLDHSSAELNDFYKELKELEQDVDDQLKAFSPLVQNIKTLQNLPPDIQIEAKSFEEKTLLAAEKQMEHDFIFAYRLLEEVTQHFNTLQPHMEGQNLPDLALEHTAPLESMNKLLETPQEPTTAPLEQIETPLEPTTAPLEQIETPLEPTTAPLEQIETPQEPTTAPLEQIETPLEPTTAPLEQIETPLEPTTAPLEHTAPLASPIDHFSESVESQLLNSEQASLDNETFELAESWLKDFEKEEEAGKEFGKETTILNSEQRAKLLAEAQELFPDLVSTDDADQAISFTENWLSQLGEEPLSKTTNEQEEFSLSIEEPTISDNQKSIQQNIVNVPTSATPTTASDLSSSSISNREKEEIMEQAQQLFQVSQEQWKQSSEESPYISEQTPAAEETMNEPITPEEQLEPQAEIEHQTESHAFSPEENELFTGEVFVPTVAVSSPDATSTIEEPLGDEMTELQSLAELASEEEQTILELDIPSPTLTISESIEPTLPQPPTDSEVNEVTDEEDEAFVIKRAATKDLPDIFSTNDSEPQKESEIDHLFTASPQSIDSQLDNIFSSFEELHKPATQDESEIPLSVGELDMEMSDEQARKKVIYKKNPERVNLQTVKNSIPEESPDTIDEQDQIEHSELLQLSQSNQEEIVRLQNQLKGNKSQLLNLKKQLKQVAAKISKPAWVNHQEQYLLIKKKLQESIQLLKKADKLNQADIIKARRATINLQRTANKLQEMQTLYQTSSDQLHELIGQYKEARQNWNEFAQRFKALKRSSHLSNQNFKLLLSELGQLLKQLKISFSAESKLDLSAFENEKEMYLDILTALEQNHSEQITALLTKIQENKVVNV